MTDSTDQLWDLFEVAVDDRIYGLLRHIEKGMADQNLYHKKCGMIEGLRLAKIDFDDQAKRLRAHELGEDDDD